MHTTTHDFSADQLRPLPEMLEYLKQMTPVKYVDGAWIQGVAKAHNLRNNNFAHHTVVNMLYNIYTEELGEGHLEMNHVAMWKDLINSLG